MSFFKSTVLAALAVSGTFAAPARVARRDNHDIVVRLTGEGVTPFEAVGFAEDETRSAVSHHYPGPFSHVQVFFSDNIKAASPGIEDRYRCTLEDEAGNRIVTVRGESVEFTFGDGGNPNPWTLKNGPFSNVKVTCGPDFKKFNDDINLIRVLLVGDDHLRQQLDFSVDEVTGRAASRTVGGASFRTVQLVLGPNVDNQKLRCQALSADGTVVLVDRGANVNKLTFGDAGKGPWVLDAAGDSIAEVSTVTCDPYFE